MAAAVVFAASGDPKRTHPACHATAAPIAATTATPMAAHGVARDARDARRAAGAGARIPAPAPAFSLSFQYSPLNTEGKY